MPQMGATWIEGFIEAGLDLEEQLLVHLTSNHYPPVPKVMVPVCIEAIDNANEGNWEEPVKLPEGVFWKGEPTAPTSAIVEQHHLEFWLIESELGDEEWEES
jgi:hypothetical protein